MSSPIVMFVYNREEHVHKTLSSLMNNNGVTESSIFIFSDGPKNKDDALKVEKVRNYLESAKKLSIFKGFHVFKENRNKGLAESVISGITKIIGDFGRVITIEDDILTSVDFLNYMNSALDYYENDERIWSISGYSFPFLHDYGKDVFLSARGCSWGIGTWKNRWETVDWQVKDYRVFRFNLARRRKFNRGGNDLSTMLDDQMAGNIDSWAIRWVYAQSKKGKYTVYPVQSKVRNIGMDGSGTHSTTSAAESFETGLNVNGSPCKFENVKYDKRIERDFRKKYHRKIRSRVRVFFRCIFSG